MKGVQFTVPLLWGDMDATPKAFVDETRRATASADCEGLT